MLTNLAHLDSLRVRIAPRAAAGHTTYRLAEEPHVEVVWTYAERGADGRFRAVGGGEVPGSGEYTQGAFNADDIARAAVVYTRHWLPVARFRGPGTYTLTLRATDKSGLTSLPARRTFSHG